MAARRCERFCCSCISLFPLVFIYGLTTWAVWVGFHAANRPSSVLVVLSYLLLNWSYTIAVFTDPGSPQVTKDSYNAIPSAETNFEPTSFTVKSTGELRFCKKCQARKPDRAHHCSSCRRCVLKMDHHCPWLATCVGLYNYKPFILFLIYTCLFCWFCFAVTASWVWAEIVGEGGGLADQLMPVNYILLAVLSGVIGLVLSGFTGWHIYLTSTGQTTIESLERVRYLTSNFRRTMHNPDMDVPLSPDNDRTIGDQIRQIHANILPGVTRPEEGEGQLSPAQDSLRNTYQRHEHQREHERYQDYLDEQESEKLPNAFDLGWRRNLSHVFGNSPFYWFLPICNTTGNGWQWAASEKWLQARDDLRIERQVKARENSGPRSSPTPAARPMTSGPPSSGVSLNSLMPPQNTNVRGGTGWDEAIPKLNGHDIQTGTEQWNDIPNDMMPSPRPNKSRAHVIRPRSPRPPLNSPGG